MHQLQIVASLIMGKVTNFAGVCSNMKNTFYLPLPSPLTIFFVILPFTVPFLWCRRANKSCTEKDDFSSYSQSYFKCSFPNECAIKWPTITSLTILKKMNSVIFFHRAAVFNRDDIISFLLDHGVPIDTRDSHSITPFLDAVAAGQTKCARLLLQRGADFKASDIYMKNCVHMAVENDHLETLHMLLEQKSVLWNLYSPDVNERVPLHYAAMVNDVRVGTIIFCMAKAWNLNTVSKETLLLGIWHA